MTDSQMIRDEEGFRAAPYKDTKDLWTFGIGFCLERTQITAQMWKYLLDNKLIDVRIAQAGAEYLTKQRLDVLRIGVPRLFRNWHELNDVRRSVLISMAYQMGLEGLAEFHDMREAIERGDFRAAAVAGLDSKWARIDTPARAKRHMNQLERGW